MVLLIFQLDPDLGGVGTPGVLDQLAGRARDLKTVCGEASKTLSTFSRSRLTFTPAMISLLIDFWYCFCVKARPLKLTHEDGYYPCEVHEATHVGLDIPGPSGYIFLPVVLGNATRKGTGCWSWNGDTEKPTLKPSVRTRGGNFLCHSFITDGKVQFLNDCTHELAGQTVDLLDFTAI